MLKEFSECVAKKTPGAIDWVVIATIIAELISGCLDSRDKLRAAIDGPTGLQRIRLNLRCRQEFGWREGPEIARLIVSEAKTFRDAKPVGAESGQTFEDLVIAEVAAL